MEGVDWLMEEGDVARTKEESCSRTHIISVSRDGWRDDTKEEEVCYNRACY